MIKEPSPKGSMAGKQRPTTIFYSEALCTSVEMGSIPRAPTAMASLPSHLCKVSTKRSIKKFQGMASSKKWASSISSIASLVYFILIIFQIPLFRWMPFFYLILSLPSIMLMIHRFDVTFKRRKHKSKEQK